MKPRYIAHTSGKQPVSDGVILECVFSDRAVVGKYPARLWRWDAVGDESDIIAYRVIEQE